MEQIDHELGSKCKKAFIYLLFIYFLRIKILNTLNANAKVVLERKEKNLWVMNVKRVPLVLSALHLNCNVTF